MTLAEYHAHPALSRSRLWTLHESPEKFKYLLENPAPPTPALILGAAFHKLALEPDDFENEYAVAPEINRRTNEGKAQWAEFEAASFGKTVISAGDFDQITGMVESLYKNETAKVLLGRGVREHSIFWTDKTTGLELKCRPDCLISDDKLQVIVDLKTCSSAETGAFTRDCLKFGYDVQAAMYSDGVTKEMPGRYAFVFIAVEKTAPYSVNVMQMGQSMIDYGMIRYHDLLDLYLKCKETDNWYGFNGAEGNMNIIELPVWAE